MTILLAIIIIIASIAICLAVIDMVRALFVPPKLFTKDLLEDTKKYNEFTRSYKKMIIKQEAEFRRLMLICDGVDSNNYLNQFHIDCLNRGLLFQTLEEAELADQARIAVTKIKCYARQKWGEFKPDWNDGSYKYAIIYNYDAELWYPISHPYSCEFSVIGYFRKEKHADEIIEKFPEELDIIRRFYT